MGGYDRVGTIQKRGKRKGGGREALADRYATEREHPTSRKEGGGGTTSEQDGVTNDVKEEWSDSDTTLKWRRRVPTTTKREERATASDVKQVRTRNEDEQKGEKQGE